MKPTKNRIPLPIVNKNAAKNFLARELDDHDYLKDVSREELHRYSTVECGYRFVTDCWHNQLVCFALGTVFDAFAFFAAPGAGKSKIISDLLRYRKRRKEISRALVLVPELLHVYSWEDQLRTHAPDLSYKLLLGTKAERFAILRERCDVFVLNYKGLESYMSRLVSVPGKQKRKQQIDDDAAERFCNHFDFVVFDESHRLGSHQSLLYKMCLWLSFRARYRYAMTGTPFGRDPTRLWSQLMLVDHGVTLGDRIGVFRNALFFPKHDYWAGIRWEFDARKASMLNRIIKHRSITYELSELHDMPKRLYIKLPIRLIGEGAEYYRRIIEGLKESRGDYESLGNLFLRMRQCVSGFLSLRADDESRVEVEFKNNQRIEALREFVTSREGKMLVFHEYTHSALLIERMLTEEGIAFSSLRGATKNPAEQYRRFLSEKKCKVFLLNNRVGSEAINPQYVCSVAVFYESPVSPETRIQAEGRVYRPGQKWNTFIYDMVALGTVDEKIVAWVREGRDLLAAVLSGKTFLKDI